MTALAGRTGACRSASPRRIRHAGKWRGARALRTCAAETKVRYHRDETQRLTLLALLLENVGVDQAVRLGDPEVWREAVRELG